MKNNKNISASEIADNYDWYVDGDESNTNDDSRTQMHKKEQLENPFSTKKQKTGVSGKKNRSLADAGSESQQPRTVKNYKTSKLDSLNAKSDIELSQILEGVEFDAGKREDQVEYFKTGTIDQQEYDTGLRQPSK